MIQVIRYILLIVGCMLSCVALTMAILIGMIYQHIKFEESKGKKK